MDKKKSIAKAACRSSKKKDGKGGPLGDGVKAVAGAVSDKVKQVGDMRVRDAVTGIAKAATLQGRVVSGAVTGGAAGAVSGAKRGIDNALGRGKGKKLGILKQALKKGSMVRATTPTLGKIAPLTTGAKVPTKVSGSNRYAPSQSYRGKITPVQKRPL